MEILTESSFDLFCGVGDENEVLELSYATFVEELQLQEILKASKIDSEFSKSEPSSSLSSPPSSSPTSTPEAISSPNSELARDDQLARAFNFKTEKELKDDVCEAVKKSECRVCHRLSCTECAVPQGSGLNCQEQKREDWEELGRGHLQSSEHSCKEQQWINEKEREHSMARKPRLRSRRRQYSKFNGIRMGDIPQTSSSTQDSKGKGIAIDDDWLLVSKRELKSEGGNRASKRWGFEHPNPLKENDGNVVHEDDYDSLDDFDSDTSQKSHESRKKSKWFKEFFERLDALNIEELNETIWHCPACQGGAGAIKWYRSISDLIAHSKKIGARRVKLHRELAELLEEELRVKGTSIAPTDHQMLGTWKGLKKDSRDHEIVWPPIVVIVNTMTNIFKDGKCVGMGSQELLQHFSSYPALKAQHSYGPQGHRGMSVLIFESSALGYLEAERLHRNFVEQGLDRFAWNCCRDVVLPGGKRQLYGFMAVKEDLDIFNQHCQGKSKIKYELRSYQEVVLNEIKKMREDSQELIWLKDRLKEERKREKTSEGSVNILSRNQQRKMEDIHLFKKRVQLLNEQKKEEIDFQENFYMEQIKILEERVKELEKLQKPDAYPLQKEEAAAPTVACHFEEYTPYQNNSKLSIHED
ncbi:hypothetical protein DITRI_Ditri02bG0066800 [Diplodiscus trichospermus]